MKNPPSTPEFARFTKAVREILKVPKGEMEERVEMHKGQGSDFLKTLPSVLPHPQSSALQSQETIAKAELV